MPGIAHYPGNLLAVIVALALDLHLHAACRAQPRDRRRIDRQNYPSTVRANFCGGVLQHGRRVLGIGVIAGVALFEILETNEKCSGVALDLAIQQAESIHDHDRFRRGMLHEIVGGVAADRAGAIEARRIGHEDDAQQIALVLGRKE